MLLPFAFILGTAFGWRRALARGGDRLDGLQYGVAYGILFALVTLVATILARRIGLF